MKIENEIKSKENEKKKKMKENEIPTYILARHGHKVSNVASQQCCQM